MMYNEYDDEWVDVLDDLPMIQKGVKQVSVNVIVETDTREQCKGFYAHDKHQWYVYSENKFKKADVVRWKSED